MVHWSDDESISHYSNENDTQSNCVALNHNAAVINPLANNRDYRSD